ncbi:MAG: endonuclease/exonuclease/phosphatase family protein [Flavisolibacter sp.]
MKPIPFILMAALVASLGCAHKTLQGKAAIKSVQSEEASTFSVLSYNIHHANPPSKPRFIDLQAIADVIKRQEVDVVALQEVDVQTARSGKDVNEAEELARLTGMQAYFAKAINYDGGAYGVAILSRLPMAEKMNIALPTDEATKGEHRTLASVILTLRNRKQLVFACTHLDAQHPDTNRQLQIKKILEEMKKKTLPVVIAGDFNAEPSSNIIAQLDSYFQRTCVNACPFTIPERHPDKTIDYIAFSPAVDFGVLSHEVVDEQYASDHRPVKAILTLKK